MNPDDSKNSTATDDVASPSSASASRTGLPAVDWGQLAHDAGADRRTCKRVTICYVLEIAGTSPAGEPFLETSRTLNVSEAGCCFESPRRLLPREIVSLTVQRRQKVGPFNFEV